MKKVIGLMMVAVFALTFVACGNKAAEKAKATADSTRRADSLAVIAKAEAEAAMAKMKADSVAAKMKADSIAAAAMPKKKK